MTPQPIQVTLITKNDCSRCDVVKRKFDNVGIAYTTINAEEDQTIYGHLNGKTAKDFVYEDLGIREMPIVVVDDNNEARDHWSGVRPDKMSALEQKISARGELFREVKTVKVTIPEVTEELVRELVADTFGGLDMEPNYFAPDAERKAVTTKDSATIPLIRYTTDGQIGARFTAQLALSLEGPDND